MLVVMVIGFLLANPAAALAESEAIDLDNPSSQITILINSNPIALDDEPILIDGRVFVPLRGVLEQVGVVVDYDAESAQITLQRDRLEVKITLSPLEVALNGEPLDIDVPPFIHDGRAYVPLRFVAEAFGERVVWSKELRQVSIWSAYVRARQQASESDPGRLAGGLAATVEFTAEEFELLARVINAEAFNEPFEGQVAVGAVVINRVKHPREFPNTIKEVILQPNQFKVVENGQINREIAKSAYEAARAALAGHDPSQGAYFFYNPDKVSSEFLLQRPITVRIGGHVFAR